MLIGEVDKNVKEKIRVSIAEYHGHRFVDVRVHFQDPSGEWLPTKKGVVVLAHAIGTVVEALQAAGKELEKTDN